MNTRKSIKKIHIFFSIIIMIFIIIIASLYISKEEFRQWVDVNILRKNITEEDIISIDLNTDKSNQIYVYNKYIAILNNQIIKLYNNYAEEITSINININKALFDSNEKYLVIAEDGGGEICLILDKTYLWSNKIEGEILQIHVNRNGYVVVITKDTTYKSILTLYNSDGTQLFKNYFSNTRVVDVSISPDNKYIAVGEIDSSGALIKSNIKIISIEDADNIYTYNEHSGKLLINVKYQSKGQISCMYDDVIQVIKNNQNNEIVSINDKQITYMSVKLDNYAVFVEEETKGVFKTNSHINIINTQNNESCTYNLEDIPKGLYANNNTIAVNVGTEVYFLNTKGWLIKKYSTKQEITNIIFSDNIAALVYKDKIIIVDL